MKKQGRAWGDKGGVALGLVPGVFSDDIDVKALIREFHAKGRYDPNPKNGSPRERVDTKRFIGRYWDLEQQRLADTSFIKIVYAKRRDKRREI